MKIAIDPRTRHTLRGLKRCPSCGTINGQRALLCRNEGCELRRRTLANQRPFDPVSLVVHAAGASLYSLRSKERDAQPRNFVTITEVTLALEEPNSAIVSRNAICFVDTCKYDACDAADISCKHIRACTVVDARKSPLPQAEVYKVEREVLWNLNIETEQKQRLWDVCKECDNHAPAVQRLNGTIFAVKCTQSKVFPAGWLHVTAVSNERQSGCSFSKSSKLKKATSPYLCACKKLKIIVEPDNSVVMQEEVCDHLLLVLAAVLSKQNGKTIYGNFTNALKSFWMPASLEIPVLDTTQEDSFFAGLNINIASSMPGERNGEQHVADDIFIFGNEYLGDDNIPDFCDIVLNCAQQNEADVVHAVSSVSTAISQTDVMHLGDPNMVSSCAEDEEDSSMQFPNVVSTVNTHDAVGVGTHLELSDCNIELMDQFHQLTDQIDLCSDDIALPIESATTPCKGLFDGNNISILAPTLPNPSTSITTAPLAVSADSMHSTILHSPARRPQSGCSLLKTAQLLPTSPASDPTTTTTLPPIEFPTIAVVKKCVPKSSEIVAEVKTRKFPHIPAKRALIVNSSTPTKQLEFEHASITEPALTYSAWLEHVIESLNESIDIVEKTDVAHTFHVHEEIFAHFSKSFSVGIKLRMPNSTTVIKSGKYKGLIKYTWYFTTPSTVRRIFSTNSLRLELERAFECNADGTFVPYVRRQNNEFPSDLKHKRIYPKLALHVAHIWFESGDKQHKTGLKLEWLPNAFPKSHFGIFNVEFSLGIRNPHKF